MMKMIKREREEEKREKRRVEEERRGKKRREEERREEERREEKRREEKKRYKNMDKSMFRTSLKPIFTSLESQEAGDEEEMKKR